MFPPPIIMYMHLNINIHTYNFLVQTTLRLLSEERKKVTILNQEISDLKDMYEEESKNDFILTKELNALRDILNVNKINDNFDNDNDDKLILKKPSDNGHDNTNHGSLNGSADAANSNQNMEINVVDIHTNCEEIANILHRRLNELHNNRDNDVGCVGDIAADNTNINGQIKDDNLINEGNKALIIDKNCWTCKNEKNAISNTISTQNLMDNENLNLIIKKKDIEITDLSQQLVIQKDIVAIITTNNSDIMELLKIEKNSILKLRDILVLEKNSKKIISDENLTLSKKFAVMKQHSSGHVLKVGISLHICIYLDIYASIQKNKHT